MGHLALKLKLELGRMFG